MTAYIIIAVEYAGTIEITVNRTGGTTGMVQVDIVSTDVTATEDEDYILPNNIIQFDDGQTSAVISINIINDNIAENEEVCYLYILFLCV